MSVEERTAFWQAKADLQMARRHLQILLASWRAAQPAIEAAGAVLDQTYQAQLQARLSSGPIPPGQMALYRPAHRDALDVCTGPDAAVVLQGFEDLLRHITTALTTRNAQQEGPDDGQHPDDRPAA
jgi:hypothetical protein